MKLEPKRNWISVDLSKGPEEEEALVLLPDDYKPEQNPHRTVVVKTDPQGEYSVGSLIVVPTHVVQEVKVKNKSFHLVERNFVMAQVE
tara:strand:- start:4677 stop:4940 length:264 start_codon:yes stop_codon:yes gene_type:complete